MHFVIMLIYSFIDININLDLTLKMDAHNYCFPPPTSQGFHMGLSGLPFLLDAISGFGHFKIGYRSVLTDY